MTASVFGKQVQNRNFLSGIAFKFNLGKYPKVDFFSNSAKIPEINLELAQQASYLKNIDGPGERLTFGDFWRTNFSKIILKFLYIFKTSYMINSFNRAPG